MLFSTPIFLFAFLPLFLAVYFLTPKSGRSVVILLGSCIFYGWWKLTYLFLILGMALFSFVMTWFAQRARAKRKAAWTCIGVIGNVATLGYFKYTFFVTSNLSMGAEFLGLGALPTWQILLPIGISFLTFQNISYILDVTRGDAPEADNLIDYLAFMTLFPQLIAGPILRYKDIADQFRARIQTLATFNEGLQRFITGLAMKLIIADSVAPLADRMFALDAPSMSEAWLGALSYTIQLFFDFAGYSAMAVGLGLMMGFRFIENFNQPYLSLSITEFWQRWHISLSTWLRDYVYVPLGGNRAGVFKTYRNLVLTMLIGGFWHGANWTFLFWGAWHGGLMALERACGIKEKQSLLPALIAWPLTMILVMIGWVVFRAPSIADALSFYAGMIGRNGVAQSPETWVLTQTSELLFLALGLALILPRPKFPKLALPHLASNVASCILLTISFIMMQARSDSPFLYFQF